MLGPLEIAVNTCYHPASVDPRSHIGNAVVWQYATVEANVTTGSGCVIGSCAWIGMNTVMGDGVRVQHGAFICRNAEIGHRVFIGPNATLTDDRYPRAGNTHYSTNPPILEDDVSVGAGAVICPGVRVRKGTTVGAGAVVVADTTEYSTVVGIPARELLAHNPIKESV